MNTLVETTFLEGKTTEEGVVLRQAEVVSSWARLAAEEVPFGEVADGVLSLRGPVSGGIVVEGSSIYALVIVVDKDGGRRKI